MPNRRTRPSPLAVFVLVVVVVPPISCPSIVPITSVVLLDHPLDLSCRGPARSRARLRAGR
uniref:Uncharacterized protein n=1 Tax=Kalanchoe fedtschenkoi TaxID=63787 RepID=A0A7N0U055_KALFE